MSAIVRLKAAFASSTRRAPHTTASPVHSSMPTSESRTPIMIHSSPETQQSPTFSASPRASTSGSIHFKESDPTSHIHRPHSQSMGRATYPRARSIDTSYMSKSRPRSLSGMQQGEANALAYVRVPVIPGYCF